MDENKQKIKKEDNFNVIVLFIGVVLSFIGLFGLSLNSEDFLMFALTFSLFGITILIARIYIMILVSNADKNDD